jgi:4-hydroxyphenylpyruvate dioxygenase
MRTTPSSRAALAKIGELQGCSRMPEWKLQTCIATVSLSGGLAEKLQAIAAAGFDAVEIFEADLLSFHEAPRDVAKMAGDLGLKILAFQPFRDFEGMPEPQRTRALARAEHKFDLVQELGCDHLFVCSNVSPDSLPGLDRAAADFHDLGDRAKKRRMRIGYEALAWGRHIHDYRDAWEIVRRADHPAVGLVLDSFHIFSRRTDLKPIRTIPSDKIFLVQLSDAPLLDMDLLQWSRHFRGFPGQGDFQLTGFMEAVSDSGYDGPLSLEAFNDEFRAGSPRSVAIDGYRSIIHLLDQSRGTSQRLAKTLPPMPPRSKCLGVEFIEFAVGEQGADELGRLFTGLGFQKVGQHKSKAVTRWSQGGINLLLNADQEGFAHSYQVTHGPSVCAVCLRVEDAAATIERSEALKDVPFRQPVGPGELEVPAVRGLGGSLIYFIDRKSELARIWNVDFDALGGAAHEDAGLVAVDHISQSMYYEEMLSWLLFYMSLFDVSKTPQQDVTDPGGIVKSQVVRTDDGALRIVLNGSQSRQTLSSRFLSEFVGSGVQHIAFATHDIVKTLQRLRANRVEMLPVPENYYDDLEARTDLSPQRLDELRKQNILYDKDESGEYLQAYTLDFQRRFFFEIVERRGYAGYGAINAPIRLGAQARLRGQRGL